MENPTQQYKNLQTAVSEIYKELDYAKRTGLLVEALQQFPDNLRLMNILAVAHVMTGRLDEALDIARQVLTGITQFTTHPQAGTAENRVKLMRSILNSRMNVAAILKRKGNLDEAAKIFAEIENEGHPNNLILVEVKLHKSTMLNTKSEQAETAEEKKILVLEALAAIMEANQIAKTCDDATPYDEKIEGQKPFTPVTSQIKTVIWYAGMTVEALRDGRLTQDDVSALNPNPENLLQDTLPLLEQIPDDESRSDYAGNIFIYLAELAVLLHEQDANAILYYFTKAQESFTHENGKAIAAMELEEFQRTLAEQSSPPKHH